MNDNETHNKPINMMPTQDESPDRMKSDKREEASEEDKRRQKKLIIYPLMGLLFLAIMWLIFAPSTDEKEKEKQQKGFNTNVPIANDAILIGDKQTAYEKEELAEKENERKGKMKDLSALFGTDMEQSLELDLVDTNEKSTQNQYAGGGGRKKPKASIETSASAYQDINRTLGNFYETPKIDAEKEKLRLELAELRERANKQQTSKDVADDQLALLEKSYELAAKYMPNQSGMVANTKVSSIKNDAELVRNGKALARPIARVEKCVVSALPQTISNEEFAQNYLEERNHSFHTASGTEKASEANTIKACIHENKTVTDGQNLKMRLLEPMKVGEYTLPSQSLITGVVKIAGERLYVKISSLEYQGVLIPVELQVYDSDGQGGIYIPGSMEMNAVKEIAANMSTTAGSSINISTDAGAQLASDLGKGVIQGTSQYISKKMGVVKVHLKAGYKLMIFQDKNN